MTNDLDCLADFEMPQFGGINNFALPSVRPLEPLQIDLSYLDEVAATLPDFSEIAAELLSSMQTY